MTTLLAPATAGACPPCITGLTNRISLKLSALRPSVQSPQANCHNRTAFGTLAFNPCVAMLLVLPFMINVDKTMDSSQRLLGDPMHLIDCPLSLLIGPLCDNASAPLAMVQLFPMPPSRRRPLGSMHCHLVHSVSCQCQHRQSPPCFNGTLNLDSDNGAFIGVACFLVHWALHLADDAFRDDQHHPCRSRMLQSPPFGCPSLQLAPHPSLASLIQRSTRLKQHCSDNCTPLPLLASGLILAHSPQHLCTINLRCSGHGSWFCFCFWIGGFEPNQRVVETLGHGRFSDPPSRLFHASVSSHAIHFPCSALHF